MLWRIITQQKLSMCKEHDEMCAGGREKIREQPPISTHLVHVWERENMNGFSRVIVVTLSQHSNMHTRASIHIHIMLELCVCARDNAGIIILSIWMCAICALKCVNNNRWGGGSGIIISSTHFVSDTAVDSLSLGLHSFYSASRLKLCTAMYTTLAQFRWLKWSERIAWMANSIVGLVSVCVSVLACEDCK